MIMEERRFEIEVAWFLKSDEADLAGDLDRVEHVLEALGNPLKFGIDHYRFQAMKKMKALIAYLRVANDIE